MMAKLHPLFRAKTASEVRAYLSNGVPANLASEGYGHTPLHLNRSISAVSELIRQKADVSVRSAHGETPLHKQQDNALIVSALIRAGADVNARDDWGDTPLHMAFSPAVAFRLLSAGADPNIRNKKGELPEDHYGDYLSSQAMRRMVREVRSRGRLLKKSWKDYYVARGRKPPRSEKKG